MKKDIGRNNKILLIELTGFPFLPGGPGGPSTPGIPSVPFSPYNY